MGPWFEINMFINKWNTNRVFLKFPNSRIEVPPPFASEHIALVIKVAASKAPYTVVTGYW